MNLKTWLWRHTGSLWFRHGEPTWGASARHQPLWSYSSSLGHSLEDLDLELTSYPGGGQDRIRRKMGIGKSYR